VKRVRVAALGLVDAVVLAELRPHTAVLRHLAEPRAWLAQQGADRATVEVASAALWLVAAWLAVGLAALCCARLPGEVGRCARGAATVVLPRAVYRLAAGAAGMGVVLAPGLAAGSTASSHASAPSAAHAVITATSSAAPVWPTDEALVPPAWPTTRSVARPQSAHAGHGVATTRPDAVVVAPGDSLWRIAAAQLPASAPPRRVATAWPRWYAANRRVIGTDPSVITPGQVLAAPSTSAEGDSG
jgi:nucleoid-associated protein YgaU